MNLQLNAIVATDIHGAIGKNNTIPWDSPYDLRHFRMQTFGAVCIIGSKTFHSLPGKLPGRRFIVLTRTPELYTSSKDVYYVGSVERALDLADKLSFGMMAWVIGGAEIYKAFAPYTKRIFHSTIEDCTVQDADTFIDWSWWDDSVEIIPFTFALRGKITKAEQNHLDWLLDKYGHKVFNVKDNDPDITGWFIEPHSPYYNPFTHLQVCHLPDHKLVDTHERAILEFERMMHRKYLDDPAAFIDYLKPLQGKNLLSFNNNGTNSRETGGNYCHGLVLAHMVDKYLNPK